MPDTFSPNTDGLTDRELGFASWWIRHQPLLRRIGYGALIALVAGFWIYVLWSLTDAFLLSRTREMQIPQRIAENQLAQSGLVNTAPEPIQSTSVLRFSNTDNRQDFVAQLANPNAQWWAEFTYHFRVGDETTPDRKAFILPSSQRYVTEIGWNGSKVNEPALEVSSVTWKRVDPLQVQRDYETFASARLRFEAVDPSYASNLTIGTKTIGQSFFSLSNASAFGYWSVDLTVLLMRQGVPIAVTTLRQEQLRPGERRPLVINWFDNPTGVTETVVQTNVNILDPNSYLPTERF